MNCVKNLFILVFFLGFSSTTVAQTLSRSQSGGNDFWRKVRFGGSIGLNFGNGYFAGSIAPSAIYPINEYFSAGAGLNFSYIKDNRYKATVYGGSVLGIVTPIPQVQLSAEFEQLRVNREIEYYDATVNDDFWHPALFLGAGYNTGPVTIGVRYNVLYNDDKSIYGSAFMPFVRIYF
ncbi:alpha-ketoglutarate decarboxylase [Mesonia sp. MT50]|uniref:Alpha-ketoglutarate decarboxylase n=1 Tax=Mesonia profundi TaxID=3070998 RepID=A0ABU0ZZS7_9FLAO|nr:alpha-ketoglutarate decarboxylase [Mesonia profundi]MDQ7916957.1 alpha-ketoglutarate decarboxylase [Mesonia profundi]